MSFLQADKKNILCIVHETIIYVGIFRNSNKFLFFDIH